MRSTRRSARLAAVLAVALAVACGSDDDGTSQPRPADDPAVGRAAALPRHRHRRQRRGRDRRRAPSASCRCRRRSPRCSTPSAPATRWWPSTRAPTTPRARRSPTSAASSPNVEAIARLRARPRRARQRPRRHRRRARRPRHPDARAARAPTTLDDVYEQIEVLGDATGHPDEAEALAGSMQADIEEIVGDRCPTATPAAALLLRAERRPQHRRRPTPSSASCSGSPGWRASPTAPTPPAGGFPQLSNEYVLDADPDVIFLAHTDGADRRPRRRSRRRPGWASSRAVAGRPRRRARRRHRLALGPAGRRPAARRDGDRHGRARG